MIHTKMTVTRKASKRKAMETRFAIVVATSPDLLNLFELTDEARPFIRSGDLDFSYIDGRDQAVDVLDEMVRAMQAAKA